MVHKSGIILWGVYVLFAAGALYLNWHEGPFDFGGPLASVKLSVWVLFGGFLVYSAVCTLHENLFRTMGTMAELWWGRQIGADLYLGLLVGLLIIFLNEGALVALLWLLPVLVFANLAILLYVAIHFDSIVAAFTVLPTT